MQDFFYPQPTLIIADGEKPHPEFVRHYSQSASTIIALDGASNWLEQHSIVPNLIIGDMDSISHPLPEDRAHITITDQETNDLYKALEHCMHTNRTQITVLGGFGQRIDHFLTNLFALDRFADRLQITLADEQQCAFLCPENSSFEIANARGNFISLFPLSNHVGPVSSSGVEYPLYNAILSMHTRIGTLNRITENQARIQCMSPHLLITTPNLYELTRKRS